MIKCLKQRLSSKVRHAVGSARDCLYSNSGGLITFLGGSSQSVCGSEWFLACRKLTGDEKQLKSSSYRAVFACPMALVRTVP